MPEPGPVDAFPRFYNNPHVVELGRSPRWTISSTKAVPGKRVKTPLDVRCFLDGGTSKAGDLLPPGTVRGAFANDETCLVTLEELTERIPRAANCAFHVQGTTDGYLVLDIEKTCPPQEAARLLSIPGILYHEQSMSGRGFHLLMPLPDNFWHWPAAANKRVLQHPEKWWEILVEHWVTFTRQPIAPERIEELRPHVPAVAPTWNEVWEELAIDAEESVRVDFDMESDKPEIPNEEMLLHALTLQDHGRVPADFDNDASRFEFAVLGVLFHRLRRITENTPFPPGQELDEQDLVWLLYQGATKMLPHRSKHDELRNGMPFLLDRAATMMALRKGDATRRR